MKDPNASLVGMYPTQTAVEVIGATAIPTNAGQALTNVGSAILDTIDLTTMEVVRPPQIQYAFHMNVQPLLGSLDAKVVQHHNLFAYRMVNVRHAMLDTILKI